MMKSVVAILATAFLMLSPGPFVQAQSSTPAATGARFPACPRSSAMSWRRWNSARRPPCAKSSPAAATASLSAATWAPASARPAGPLDVADDALPLGAVLEEDAEDGVGPCQVRVRGQPCFHALGVADQFAMMAPGRSVLCRAVVEVPEAAIDRKVTPPIVRIAFEGHAFSGIDLTDDIRTAAQRRLERGLLEGRGIDRVPRQHRHQSENEWQLAIIAAFLPLAFVLRATRVYRRLVFAGGSAAIALVATLWLVERAFDVKL